MTELDRAGIGDLPEPFPAEVAMIREQIERLIARTPDGNRTFFDEASFPWIETIESQWKAIREELDGLLLERDRVPNFQDISADQKILTERDQWKTFFLHAYGHRVLENCRRCPRTAAALSQIPGMKTAMFSILAPGKHVPEHRGPYKGVLRYHLGLLIPPQPEGACRIRVGDDVRRWEEGKSLVFDDAHPHEAWNESDRYRAILFVDFLRPLPEPLSTLNSIMVWRIGTTPFITEAVQNIRKHALEEARLRRGAV